MAIPNVIQQKNYWYYSNGFYELESIQYSDGTQAQLNRHVTGPMPKREILHILREGVQINPNTPTWQADVITKLAANRFNTINILAGVPREANLTTVAFLQSFLTIETAAKTALVGGSIAFIAVSPGLIAQYAPHIATQLGWVSIGEASLVKYSMARWSAILIPSVPSTALEIFLSVGQAYVITKISRFVFNKLNETCGPKGFEAWRAAKMDIFIQNRGEMIPDAYQNDPILSANICPVTQWPIRVPSRTIYGHVFEESAIMSWLAQQIANGIAPTCPLTRQPLSMQNVVVDTVLSDRIELRLLLLQT